MRSVRNIKVSVWFHECKGVLLHKFNYIPLELMHGVCLIHVRTDTIYDPVFQERICKLGLVYTTSSLIEMPIAFPIRKELANGCEFPCIFVFHSGFNFFIAYSICLLRYVKSRIGRSMLNKSKVFRFKLS